MKWGFFFVNSASRASYILLFETNLIQSFHKYLKFHYWNLSGYSDLSVDEGVVGRGEELCEEDLGVKSGMVNV